MCTNMGGTNRNKRNDGQFRKVDFSGMPNLTGSEKQIKWAESIRNGAIETVNGNIELFSERIKQYGNIDLYVDTINAYRHIGKQLSDTLKNITSASKIIDKRDMFSFSRIGHLANEIVNEYERERRKK